MLLPASITSKLSIHDAGQGANGQCEVEKEKPKVDTIDMMLMRIRVSEHQTEGDLESGSKFNHLRAEKFQERRSG